MGFLRDLLPYLIPIIVGAITVPLYDGLQAAIRFLQSLPAWLTRILVGIAAFGLGKLVELGVDLTTVDPTLFSQSDIAAIAAAALAFLFKLANRQEEIR